MVREPRILGTLIYGRAPTTRKLAFQDHIAALDAIAKGLDIVSELNQFVIEDPEIAAFTSKKDVTVGDIRKPKPCSTVGLFVWQKRVSAMSRDGEKLAPQTRFR